MFVPVIDFSKCSLLHSADSVSDDSYKDAGNHLYKAFNTTGFAYLSNTGIPRANTDAVNDAASVFFSQPIEYKKRFFSDTHTETSYQPLNYLTLNPERPSDYQEGFRFSVQDDPERWPKVFTMDDNAVELKRLCKLFMLRVLLALGHGMNLKDPEILVNSHQLLNKPGNGSFLKLVHYPPVTKATKLEEGQLRIGEHTDFGSLTLLFQDEVGGLQAQGTDGEFVDVPYIPETVLIGVGDMMQFWTGGRLKSTVHRVVIPKDPVRSALIRRSIAYFVNADDDVLLNKLEFNISAEEKVDPPRQSITSREYFVRRFQDAYT